jgi:hypothetical protein
MDTSTDGDTISDPGTIPNTSADISPIDNPSTETDIVLELDLPILSGENHKLSNEVYDQKEFKAHRRIKGTRRCQFISSSSRPDEWYSGEKRVRKYGSIFQQTNSLSPIFSPATELVQSAALACMLRSSMTCSNTHSTLRKGRPSSFPTDLRDH